MKIENLTIGGMRGYVQCADESRWTPPDKDGWMTSTVQAGDRWQDGGDTSDDRKSSERCEFRALDEDAVGGAPVRYEFCILIPEDYPEFSPKQTFAQGFADDHPAWFIRYELGELEFCLNYKSTLNARWTIPFTKGRSVRIVIAVDYAPGLDAGSVMVLANGKTVCSEKKVSIVEIGARSVYLKVGIYRSGMDRYAGVAPAPAQTVRHRLMSKTLLDREPDSPKSIPVPTPAPSPTPAATPVPTPAPDNGLVARMAWLRSELDTLAKDVGRQVPSAGTMIIQASEKVAKAAAQISKASGKGR